MSDKHTFNEADEATLEGEAQVDRPGWRRLKPIFGRPSGWVFVGLLVTSFLVGQHIKPTWTVEKIRLDVKTDAQGKLFYKFKGKAKPISLTPYWRSPLNPDHVAMLNLRGEAPAVTEQFIAEQIKGKPVYSQLKASRHWGIWSLFPAFVAILMCWVIKEPLTALLSGVVAGAFILGQYDFVEELVLPSLMTKGAAGVLILYLWLLGGLMGIWSRTGAAQAFAEYVTRKFVRGPRTAKLTAWMLGVIFFQGGTVSTVLVGTTVKPIADKENISHEELSYIVDSTASPIASLIAFNAWPGYVQAFMFVGGVSFLATEADRISFFFQSIPFSFYAIFAVIGTLFLSIDKAPFLGKKMRNAIKRSRETGELDAPEAEPLAAKELQASNVPEGYKPSVNDFTLPLGLLIGTALVSYFLTGSPNVRLAFGLAVLVAALMAMFKGMGIHDLMVGIGEGLKGVVLGSVILLLAITIGMVAKATGGGVYLVEMLGDQLPYWALPVILQILTITIAFSTGTSWGTYAVALPLAMPLAWAVANSQNLANPETYMAICFATVLNGSVMGDQCSPISDTTILSSMCTGCDLMDHVQTQIPPASIAAVLAAICWTGSALLFA